MGDFCTVRLGAIRSRRTFLSDFSQRFGPLQDGIEHRRG